MPVPVYVKIPYFPDSVYLLRFSDVASGASMNSISPKSFPLCDLAAVLETMSEDIHTGKGVAIIEGLQPDKYTVEENIIIHAGISSYIAPQRGCQSGMKDQVCGLSSFHQT